MSPVQMWIQMLCQMHACTDNCLRHLFLGELGHGTQNTMFSRSELGLWGVKGALLFSFFPVWGGWGVRILNIPTYFVCNFASLVLKPDPLTANQAAEQRMPRVQHSAVIVQCSLTEHSSSPKPGKHWFLHQAPEWCHCSTPLWDQQSSLPPWGWGRGVLGAILLHPQAASEAQMPEGCLHPDLLHVLRVDSRFSDTGTHLLNGSINPCCNSISVPLADVSSMNFPKKWTSPGPCAGSALEAEPCLLLLFFFWNIKATGRLYSLFLYDHRNLEKVPLF